jgi:hypothetical protein
LQSSVLSHFSAWTVTEWDGWAGRQAGRQYSLYEPDGSKRCERRRDFYSDKGLSRDILGFDADTTSLHGAKTRSEKRYRLLGFWYVHSKLSSFPL